MACEQKQIFCSCQLKLNETQSRKLEPNRQLERGELSSASAVNRQSNRRHQGRSFLQKAYHTAPPTNIYLAPYWHCKQQNHYHRHHHHCHHHVLEESVGALGDCTQPQSERMVTPAGRSHAHSSSDGFFTNQPPSCTPSLTRGSRIRDERHGCYPHNTPKESARKRKKTNRIVTNKNKNKKPKLNETLST